jgi:hypothetical protein
MPVLNHSLVEFFAKMQNSYAFLQKTWLLTTCQSGGADALLLRKPIVHIRKLPLPFLML